MKNNRRLIWGALLSALLLIIVVCLTVPSVRGFLTSIKQQIEGRVVRYFNSELQNDGIRFVVFHFFQRGEDAGLCRLLRRGKVHADQRTAGRGQAEDERPQKR